MTCAGTDDVCKADDVWRQHSCNRAEDFSADWLLIGYIQFGSGSEEGWQGAYVGGAKISGN